MNGPVAISLPFKCAFCSLVDVIGGPLKALMQQYLSICLMRLMAVRCRYLNSFISK